MSRKETMMSKRKIPKWDKNRAFTVDDFLSPEEQAAERRAEKKRIMALLKKYNCVVPQSALR